MNKKLDIEGLEKEFANKKSFTVQDIFIFYKEKEPLIPKTTVNWRIYDLAQQGIIERIGKGIYRFGKTQLFIPKVNEKMSSIGKAIKSHFPFINYCQWELSNVNYFSHHLINFNILFVDVEREVQQSVYYKLKESFPKVMLIKNLFDDLSEFDDTIFIRPLMSDSPVLKEKNTYVAKLEKILVDLYADKEFVSFQGNEIHNIFNSAFEKYTINQQTLLRYAGRKNKKGEIEKIIKTINRQ